MFKLIFIIYDDYYSMRKNYVCVQILATEAFFLLKSCILVLGLNLRWINYSWNNLSQNTKHMA